VCCWNSVVEATNNFVCETGRKKTWAKQNIVWCEEYVNGYRTLIGLRIKILKKKKKKGVDPESRTLR
jgi:hypothetical protein